MNARELPRRCYVDLMVPAERAIRAAVLAVEALPADLRLTEAVLLLGQAKDKVSDFIDAAPALPPDDPPALIALIAAVDEDRARGNLSFAEDIGSGFRVATAAYRFVDALRALPAGPAAPPTITETPHGD